MPDTSLVNQRTPFLLPAKNIVPNGSHFRALSKRDSSAMQTLKNSEKFLESSVHSALTEKE